MTHHKSRFNKFRNAISLIMIINYSVICYKTPPPPPLALVALRFGRASDRRVFNFSLMRLAWSGYPADSVRSVWSQNLWPALRAARRIASLSMPSNLCPNLFITHALLRCSNPTLEDSSGERPGPLCPSCAALS